MPTWKSWGSRLVTPRAHIATLLARVARSRPFAIALDVDLAYPDGTDGKALKDFLEDYKPEWPPLLLVRSLANDPDGGLPHPRITNYDDAIGQRTVNGQLVPAKDNVMFTSPLFERDADGKVRRWKLFAEACNGGAPIVVPSMHLAAAMIARQAIYGAPPGEEDLPLKRMTSSLAAFTPANCQPVSGGRKGTLDSLPLDRPIEIEDDDVSKRVIYRVAWKPGEVGLGPVVDMPAGGGRTQLVAVRPARLAVAGDPDAALPDLEGKIVVIGGSFLEQWRPLQHAARRHAGLADDHQRHRGPYPERDAAGIPDPLPHRDQPSCDPRRLGSDFDLASDRCCGRLQRFPPPPDVYPSQQLSSRRGAGSCGSSGRRFRA